MVQNKWLKIEFLSFTTLDIALFPFFLCWLGAKVECDQIWNSKCQYCYSCNL